MPFTPFHFGLGYAATGIEKKPQLLCFYTFVVTQIVIDVETLRNILNRAPQLHTFCHTFLGSLVAAGLSIPIALASFLVGDFILKYLPSFIKDFIYTLRLFPETKPTFKILLFSAWFGAWSHVLLDAMMHSDTLPFSPWSQENPFLGWIPVGFLHLALFVLLVLGFLLLLLRRFILTKN